ncbi:MAG: M14 family zinc carboxypeptidase [Chthoniobacteraceae bacterium]
MATPRWFALLLILLCGVRAELKVATDFEGGSARVISIDDATQTIRFMPGGDPARGWPCWWFLRVDGAEPGAIIAFEIVASDRVIPQTGGNKGKPLPVSWATPVRAAVSSDGTTLQHTEPGGKRADGMTWRVKAGAKSVWLAWGPPFTPRDAAALVKSLPHGEPFTLARSREGRDVPGVRVGNGGFGVWVQARQHAWESGSSWVCRGFAEWIAGDDEAARWLREHAEIFIVPLMDVDHVATGDGGKEALPQDHNRDWSDAAHWPEVAAAQQRLASLAAANRLDVFLDLHNPGPGDLSSFFFAGEDSMVPEAARKNRDRFFALTKEHLRGPIPHDPKPRPSGANYHPLWRQMSGNWVTAHGNPHTLSLCLETAWNTPASTTAGYMSTGAQLAAAVAAYLRENPRAAR